ncbi:MAG: hypothetical protein K2L05_04055 [Muribaculaceae bacterium]|nr:hypothetical protein [Muribaculaceae bacterium]
MRLFVFAIGGTGSRVLRSMIMQFAAGITPTDPQGKPYEDLSVVPIIIDPHTENKDLQETNKLMMRYKSIHESIYGSKYRPNMFYGVKIESLKDISTNENNGNTYDIEDSFFFNMESTISAHTFKEFIGANDHSVSRDAKRLISSLFSSDELNTEMSEGFYGSPNIGTIALNVFQRSDSYTALAQSFRKGDRILFIGSIFGGTGASGLPMLVSSIRQDEKNTALSEAFIGALIVMPYFAIAEREDSEIQGKDFWIKTKTALKYYVDNLYPYLNMVYYVADPATTDPFENDPGKGGQKSNRAHFVEFIGGLTAFDLLSAKAESDGDGSNVTVKNGRKEANSRKIKQFELKENANFISFKHLSKEVNQLILKPMIGFHFLNRFVDGGYFNNNLSQSFAKNGEIDKAAISDDFITFINNYYTWLTEMANQGSTAHNFTPFRLPVPDSKDFTADVEEIPVKKATFGKKSIDAGDVVTKLNKSSKHKEAQTAAGRFIFMAQDAMNQLIDETYDLINII